MKRATELLYRALPDLSAFDLTRARGAQRLPIALSDVLLPLAYAIGYAALVLIAATWIFERRDFR